MPIFDQSINPSPIHQSMKHPSPMWQSERPPPHIYVLQTIETGLPPIGSRLARIGKCDVNPMSIGEQSRDRHGNKCSMRSDRSVSTEDALASTRPIPYQSWANLPIHMPIYDQSANPGTNPPTQCQSMTNPTVQCQYITNPPIRCQSMTNPPIHHQSANPGPICQYITNPGLDTLSAHPSAPFIKTGLAPDWH